MTDEEYDEQEERAERISEVKKRIAVQLEQAGVTALPWELEGDVYVDGPLTVILEALDGWRSELEELG